MFTRTRTEYTEKPHTLTHLKQWLIHNCADFFMSEQSTQTISMCDLAADRPAWWRWAYLGL